MHIVLNRRYPKHKYIIGELSINGQFLCNTLEPSEQRLPFPCIPKGTYEIKMAVSSKFRARRPFVMNVPNRIGIMIHEGNCVSETRGCILLGDNTYRGMVLNSKKRLNEFMAVIGNAFRAGQRVFLTVEDR